MRKVFVSLITVLFVIVVTCTTIPGAVNTTTTNSPPASFSMITVAGSDLNCLAENNSPPTTYADNRIITAQANNSVVNFSLKILSSNTAERNAKNLMCVRSDDNLKELAINMPLKYPLISPTQMNKTSLLNSAAAQITEYKNAGFKKSDMLSIQITKVSST